MRYGPIVSARSVLAPVEKAGDVLVEQPLDLGPERVVRGLAREELGALRAGELARTKEEVVDPIELLFVHRRSARARRAARQLGLQPGAGDVPVLVDLPR